MARFNGKPMIQTKVANGINKAEELLTEAMAGTAAVYQASAADREAAEIAASASDSVGRQIYKHLMNGVSHMLPFRYWWRYLDCPCIPIRYIRSCES